jgi:uncharacterized Zn finger protein
MRRRRWWIKTVYDVPDDQLLRIASPDGPEVHSWWAQAFLDVVLKNGEKGRLQRAKKCANTGSGSRLRITEHQVKIGICCSGYTIRDVLIVFPYTRGINYDLIADAIAGDGALTGALLAGNLSKELVRVFLDHGVDLLPTALSQYYTICGCGDSESLCIHEIVAWYLFAEVLDKNPWHLLTIQGTSYEALVASVKKSRERLLDIQEAEEDTCGQTLLPSHADPIGFFSLPGSIDTLPGLAMQEMRVNPVVLLGPAPLTLGGKNLADRIIGIYDGVSRYLREREDSLD